MLGAAVHRLTREQPLPRQVLALKALSILFGAVTIVAAFLVAREIVPGRPELAVLTSATVAFVPMFTAISAAINNDGLAIALASVTLAALLVGWRRGFGVRGAVALGVLLGLVLLTKLTIYVYVPLALATLFLRERRVALITALVALSIASPWLIRNMAVYGLADPLGLVRHDAVVVGQPRWDTFVPPADLHALDFFFRILFRSFWGVFGWMGVILDDGFYVLYLILTLLALLGLLLTWARRSGHGSSLGVRAPWLIGAPILLVFAEVAYYNLTFVQPQGRYLFPALVPLAVALSVGWGRLADTLRSRHRLGALPAGLLAAALGWAFGEWHGAVRATALWSDNALVTAALLSGGLALALRRSWRARLPVALVGLMGLVLGLLDYATLVRFVAPAFPSR